MKQFTHLFFVMALTCFSTFAQKSSSTDASIPKVYKLNDMVAGINKSIIEASKILEKEKVALKIKEAEITLQTIYDTSGGGEFKLFAKASKKWELEKTSTMTFSYTKDEKLLPKSAAKITFEKKLTDGIVEAAKQWRESSETVTGLSKGNFNVEISFLAKETQGGGVEFEVWGIGADLGIEFENTAVHTVSLTFE